MHNEDCITPSAQSGKDNPEQQPTTPHTAHIKPSPTHRTPRPLRVEYRQIDPPPTNADLDSILARIYNLALLRSNERAAQAQQADGETAQPESEVVP